LFYSRVESNAEMMAEKVLTVKQALTITDVIELLESSPDPESHPRASPETQGWSSVPLLF